MLAARKKPKLSQPQKSGIEHVVIVMMENRSFDHFLGWVPGADGRQAGLSYPDRMGVLQPTFPLAPDYQGCSHPDPDHTYAGGRVEYNNGACDGWLRAGNNDLYAIGYYTQNDLPFYAGAAQNWTVLDNYFSAIMAGTYPNKIYQHAGQTDRLENSLSISSLPTIWDRLADHSLEGKYYFSDVPFLALWGTKYLHLMHHVSEFLDDCASGNLPHVSMVDPRFLGEALGVTNDDHPHADIRNGQVFLSEIYNAVTTSPNWPNTVLVINYDEWGGFFDHVPPQTAPIPPADAALGSDGLRGFRTPAFVIAPWAPAGQVAHQLFDHTSVLRMIEWRWHLRPLTVRDATANNMAEIFDFSRPNLNPPPLVMPPGPYGQPCPITVLPDKWTLLAELAERLGVIILQ
jgi:phospholipase C